MPAIRRVQLNTFALARLSKEPDSFSRATCVEIHSGATAYLHVSVNAADRKRRAQPSGL